MTGTPVRDRARDRRLDGRPVLGEDDQHVGALGDQVLHVGGLRLGRRLGVVRHVGAAAGLDRLLDRRLVELGPAFLLVVVPGDADHAVPAAATTLGGVARNCRRSSSPHATRTRQRTCSAPTIHGPRALTSTNPPLVALTLSSCAVARMVAIDLRACRDDARTRPPRRRCGSIGRMRARPMSRRVIAMVVVAVAAAGGLAFANARDRGTNPPIAPHFVDDTAASGIDHRYEGEFQFFVGGGVAAFDCDDDGLPDLYLAGGSEPAALYRNESTPAGPLRFTPVASATTDLTGVTGAYPIDIDGDGHVDLAVLRVGEDVVLRGHGDCEFERANELLGHRRRRLVDRSRSARHGKGRTPCRRWRSATTWRRTGQSCEDSRLFRPAAPPATRRRWRSPPATARCPSCSATGSAPDGAICA